MGNDVGDINNDGLLDIVVLDMLPDVEKIRKQSGGEDDYELAEMKLKDGYNHQYVRNTLQLNLGGGMFSEIGLLAGLQLRTGVGHLCSVMWIMMAGKIFYHQWHLPKSK